jgi:glutathione synthase/RimK-type ligase-like ATP-grasp enzyme
MKTYDVGIGWAHPADKKFAEAMKSYFKERNISFREITYVNLNHSFKAIDKGALNFKFFIDRSSEDHPAYLLMSSILQSRGATIINDPRSCIYFSDKAQLHLLFASLNLPLPKSFIIAPSTRSRKVLMKVVEELKFPFVLKPSYGGGGENVFVNMRHSDDIIDFLEDNCTDRCIAQEYVMPATINNRSAWFRPIFVCGAVIPLWWDPKNHVYQRFGNTPKEIDIAKALDSFSRTIAKNTGLQFFSTEVAMTEEGKYLIVDYANQPIDVNTSEVARNGLPPLVVEEIVNHLGSYIVNSFDATKKELSFA